MKNHSEFPLRSLFIGAVLSVMGGSSIGQTAPLPSDQIPGDQLQTWLDQKFSYAGLHHPSGCYFMNSPFGQGPTGRVLFLSCPNGWADKMFGTARVAGDTVCTNFPIPNSPREEECLSWHATGDAKFEQRKNGVRNTTLYVVSATPMRSK